MTEIITNGENSIFGDHHVLIIDEDSFMAKILEAILFSFGVGKITIIQEVEEAHKYLEIHSIDCIMLEWFGWEKPQLEILPFVRKSEEAEKRKIPVIMCTGHSDYRHVMRVRDGGANEVIVKPIAPVHVYEKLYSALFKVRNFIAEDSFTGPDRRRRAKEYNGEERRIKEPMVQAEVDELMEESTS